MPPTEVQQELRDAYKFALFMEWLEGAGYEVVNVVRSMSPFSSLGVRSSAFQVFEREKGGRCGCFLYSLEDDGWGLYGPCGQDSGATECGPCPQDNCPERR